MKILKLLNKKNLSIVIFSLFSFSSFAEDKPVDIWNIEKQETENISEENLSTENKQVVSESSVYKMQSDKNEDSIKLDQELTSKTIKIAGLYDPQEYGLGAGDLSPSQRESARVALASPLWTADSS